VKSVDTAPRLERLREPGFPETLEAPLHAVHAHRNAIAMNENDFECLAKTRVNTPPMAKMTGNPEVIETASQRTEEIERG